MFPPSVAAGNVLRSMEASRPDLQRPLFSNGELGPALSRPQITTDMLLTQKYE
jgi:hypothetical protein